MALKGYLHSDVLGIRKNKKSKHRGEMFLLESKFYTGIFVAKTKKHKKHKTF